MIFLLSSHSNNSEHVLREVQCAVDRHIPIIPLRLEGVVPQGSFEYHMTTRHWLEISAQPTTADMDAIVGAARQHLSKGGKTSAYKDQYSLAEESYRRQQWRLCVSQCLAILDSAMKLLFKDLLNSLKDSSRKKETLTILRKIVTGRITLPRLDAAVDKLTFPQFDFCPF